MSEFLAYVKRAVKLRSGGRCECTRKCSHHMKRCTRPAVEFRFVEEGGPTTVENCEHLCDICHRNK